MKDALVLATYLDVLVRDTDVYLFKVVLSGTVWVAETTEAMGVYRRETPSKLYAGTHIDFIGKPIYCWKRNNAGYLTLKKYRG